MRARSLVLATLLASTALISPAPAEDQGPAPKPAAPEPVQKRVLVELFTSQG